MDIQRKAFESSNNVNPDWSFKFDEELQQYVALDGEMKLQVDEFNEHWDTFRAGWEAKAQVVPEGCLLMPRKCTNKMAHAAKAVDGRLSAFKYADVYKAMIEAQVPDNDSH
ncbi:hypothetical protein FOB20_11220 [Acinetobacter lwoffii]|uniref:hypothetical protein n=1 Tax=Acinetobacter lwoffii TaxID=28090 RepID=UPI001583D85D|nr:hypothetical protein [Acinetobacter lwoffii]QKT99295.1 hypothetical protein FOB20_11220 [Acinetobacter lwoffii]